MSYFMDLGQGIWSKETLVLQVGMRRYDKHRVEITEWFSSFLVLFHLLTPIWFVGSVSFPLLVQELARIKSKHNKSSSGVNKW